MKSKDHCEGLALGVPGKLAGVVEVGLRGGGAKAVGGGRLIWKMQGDVNMCRFVISMLPPPSWQYSKQTAGRRGNICRLRRR